jgi:hypothetical protein
VDNLTVAHRRQRTNRQLFEGVNKINKKSIYALIFCAAAMNANAITSRIFGEPDCGEWVLKNNNNNKAWVMGFISGLNFGHDEARLKPANPLKNLGSAEQLFLWVDNYCKNNPLGTVGNAAEALIFELKKR